MPYENYLTEYGAEEIRFGKMIDDSAVGEAIINGGLGGGGTSLTPAGVATGIDTSSDIEDIKTNIQLGFNPSPVSFSAPTSGSTPIILPKTGFYHLKVQSGTLNGNLSLTSGGINLILNTGTIQTENIQSTYRDYYFWTGTPAITILAGTNTASANLIFTPMSFIPGIAESFSGIAVLNAGANTQISSRGFSYIHIDNDNFALSEQGVAFSPRYSGWVQLRGNTFTLTNFTGSTQTYNFKLSNSPNNAGTSALLDSTIRGEGVSALNRTVIAGVTNSGTTKTPVLDSSGRFQVTDSQLLTIANRDSLDYPTSFTVFGSANSSFAVATPVNRYIVKSIYCRNNAGGNFYLQLFNKTSPPTTGDVPLMSILVAGNTSITLNSDFFPSKGFLLPNVVSGTVYIAQSSTEATFTASTHNISIHMFGVDRVIT